ncbi:hypothetical protein HNR06_001604 [Nocardiopsis arvandica]|uniref:Uncharacterized protein n=1 Tax=Nocardiopsis sinuspersici TaxID=501010 RepID=A0A7Y9XC26_9ACTN|nr:immunity 49 family protein [Nocardiopsis sinuspersici]NYH52015.1 hypothetical protein [Nocardiopsis sinuspersici]
MEFKMESRGKKIRRFEQDSSNAEMALWPVYRVAELSLLPDPEAARVETWESWAIAMQLHSAVFAVSEAEEGSEVACLIDHEVRTLKAPGLLHCADPSNWRTAFRLAVICRDNTRAEALCHIPVERLRQAAERGGVEHNEYTYHWVAALQAYVNGTDDLVSELRSAMDLSDPRRAAFGGEALDLFVLPRIEVFRHLLTSDADKFNEALVQALETFNHCYTREEDPNDLDGIVPLSPGHGVPGP